MNKWIPLDYYHQKPNKGQIVTLTDGKDIFHDMVWLDAFSYGGEHYIEGWYNLNETKPLDKKPTHWLILELPK